MEGYLGAMRYLQETSDSETKAKVTCLPTVAVAVTAAGKERESGFESADTEAVAQIAGGGIMSCSMIDIVGSLDFWRSCWMIS